MRFDTKIISYFMAAIFFLNIFIFPAITIYLANIDHFAISLFSALKVGITVFAIFYLPTILLLSVLSTQLQKIASLCFAGLGLLCWVQGSLLVWDYGVLDGRNIKWNEYQPELWIDVFVWLVLSGAMMYIAHKNSKLIIKSAILIFLLQAVTAVSGILLERSQIFQENDMPIAGNLQQIVNFSKDTNILHIVADGFQSDVFESLISNPKLKEKYDESFNGFVFFRETLGIFPYTRFSVPAFLSGKIYANDGIKNDYIDGILRGRTIISLARDNNFDIDLIADGDYLIGRYKNLPHANIFDIQNMPGLNNYLASSALLFDLSLFRIAPGPVKKYLYRDQKWLVSQFILEDESLQFRYFTHTYFFNYLVHQIRADRNVPVYKYLHVMNTHNPMVVNEDCSYSGRAAESTRYKLTIQSKCTLDTFSALMESMKKLGIYDDALIIIHGDHGGWVDNYRQGPKLGIEDGIIGKNSIKSLASPLLAIKIPKANGEITTSNVLASLLDIPDTISHIMGWKNNFNHRSLTTLKDGEKRKRFFWYYDWQENAWEAEHLGPILEFSVDGSHYEVEWKTERIIMPSK